MSDEGSPTCYGSDPNLAARPPCSGIARRSIRCTCSIGSPATVHMYADASSRRHDKDMTTDQFLRHHDVDEFRGSSPSKSPRCEAFDKGVDL